MLAAPDILHIIWLGWTGASAWDPACIHAGALLTYIFAYYLNLQSGYILSSCFFLI